MEDFAGALSVVERAALELQCGQPSPEAQKILLGLQDQSNPYELCKYILEHSKVPTAQFQGISTIRRAALREWSALSPQFREEIRAFLIQFLVHNHSGLQNFVKAHLLQCVASLVKREWVDIEFPSSSSSPDSNLKEAICQQILAMLNADMQMKHHGVGLMLALVNEFSSHSEGKLPATYHAKCNSSFADKELKLLLTWTMGLIHQFITDPSSLQNDTSFLRSCLNLAVQILSWDFKLSQPTSEGLLFARSNPNEELVLQPPSHYRDILINSNNILLCFFKLFGMVEQDENLSLLTKAALSQLASLSGNIFPDTSHRVQYLKTFLELLVPHMKKYTAMISAMGPSSSLSPPFGVQVTGLCNVLVRLVSNFRLDLFYQIPPVPAALDAFLSEFCAFTCGCLQSLKSIEEAEYSWNLECFSYLADAWLVFVDSYPLLPLLVCDFEEDQGDSQESKARWEAVKATLQKYTCTVFQLYVNVRITIARSELEQDLVENENCDDKKEFEEQLEVMGRLGRVDLTHSLQLVASMLGERVSKWQSQVQQRNAHGLDTILEELHWLTMIMGHVLTNTPKDDIAHIPAAINAFSDESDAVISATNAVMAVLQFQNCCLTNDSLDGFDDIVSPLLAQTLLWFVERWCATYLTIHRQRTSPSERLKTAYGTDSGMVPHMVGFFFASISSIVMHWSGSEPELAAQACELFLCLSKLPFRTVLLQLEVYQNFFQAYTDRAFALESLPVRLHRPLVEALVRMGSGINNSETLERYFQQIASPIQSDFSKISSDFSSIAQNAKVTQHVERLINRLRGLARAGKGGGNISRATLHACLQHLEKIASLIHIYSHRSDILKDINGLFNDLLLFQIDSLKAQGEAEMLLNGIFHFFKALSELSKEKSVSIGGEKEREKQRYREAKQRTTTLYHLFYHFICDASGPCMYPEVQYKAKQLVLFALTSCILPLITSELMQYAKVRQGYFSITCGLFEEESLSLLSLPPQIYSLLMFSLKYALLSTDTDIAVRGLETVCSVCSYHCFALAHNAIPSSPSQPLPTEAVQCISSGHQVLADFLRLLFNQVLLSSSTSLISSSLLPQASNALFSTICCHKDLFSQLVNQVLEKSPAHTRPKISQEFQTLTSADNLQMSVDESNMKKWRKNVLHFLQNTQGLLIFND